MQEDERDILEVLIFDEIEETVGTWLRTIIQRLEKEQAAIRRDHHKSQTQAAKHWEECSSTRSSIRSVQNQCFRLRWTGGVKLFRFPAGPASVNSL
jgi:hypothetical protein